MCLAISLVTSVHLPRLEFRFLIVDNEANQIISLNPICPAPWLFNSLQYYLVSPPMQGDWGVFYIFDIGSGLEVEEKRIRSGTKNLSCISFRGLWSESVISILHSSSFTYPGAKIRRNIYTTNFFRKLACKKSLKPHNLLFVIYLHIFRLRLYVENN